MPSGCVAQSGTETAAPCERAGPRRSVWSGGLQTLRLCVELSGELAGRGGEEVMSPSGSAVPEPLCKAAGVEVSAPVAEWSSCPAGYH